MQHIRDIIEDFIKKTNIMETIESDFIFENWEKIVGKDISKMASPIKLYKDKLFINVENSVIMEEMNYRKKELINKINLVFKDKKIKDIIFKIQT
ncbi:MAG TPA: DUF721 domain-containing protein [Candidatus Goldiibacteriota bacterium]|nr:DUF721 domain-containing protein [Candidatus Goldiibacteriota bacterium]